MLGFKILYERIYDISLKKKRYDIIKNINTWSSFNFDTKIYSSFY